MDDSYDGRVWNSDDNCWEWPSAAPRARDEQDAGLGQTVRERVAADRENTRAIRASQQADPEGIVERVAAYTEPRFEHDSPHAPQQPSETLTLPQTTEARKEIPLASGVLDYFPAALAEVAKVSKAGNDKHNPGQPLHWARGKSMDQADCIARHLLERGGIDPETGQLHSAQMAWRALALLQLELEEKGAPMARGARA